MEATTGKEALIAGASIAGLVTAYWLGKAGYRVTVVEQAPALRLGGAAVNLEGAALDVVKRMGLFAQLQAVSLRLERWEFKNAADETVGALDLRTGELPQAGEPAEPAQLEIEREQLLPLLRSVVDPNTTFLFANRLVALRETPRCTPRLPMGRSARLTWSLGATVCTRGFAASGSGPKRTTPTFYSTTSRSPSSPSCWCRPTRPSSIMYRVRS
jgi:2-polyprenyl-6-methoxyphenol hydroxylase-like FAD-dependent oxidoreductase